MSSVDEETTETEAATPADDTARDELREELLEGFRAELGDAVVGHHIRPGDDLWVRVTTDAWATTAEVARRRLGYAYFSFLSAMDWQASPFGRYEEAEVDTPLEDRLSQPAGDLDTGYAGGDTRFQVFARVVNIRRHVAVTLEADVPDESFTVDTWSPIYAGADWHERETWEMFGIVFRGHPNLIHIYLPSEFEGFPLRKDFPLLARVVKPWPGIVDVEPMPAGEGEEAEEEGETPDSTTAEAESPEEAPAPQDVEATPSGQKEGEPGEPEEEQEGEREAAQAPAGAADDVTASPGGSAGEPEGRVAQDDIAPAGAAGDVTASPEGSAGEAEGRVAPDS